QPDPQAALDDQEQFVLRLVMVPDKLPFDFDELHVGVVELAHDLRAPVILEETELAGEIDCFHRRPPCGARAAARARRPGPAGRGAGAVEDGRAGGGRGGPRVRGGGGRGGGTAGAVPRGAPPTAPRSPGRSAVFRA